MTSSYKENLKYHERDLLDNMDVNVFRIELMQKGVLDLDQNEALRDETSIRERNKMFLGFLQNAGLDAYQNFIAVLKSNNYGVLAEKLETEIPDETSGNEQLPRHARIEVPVFKRDKHLTQPQLLHLSKTVLVRDMFVLATNLKVGKNEVECIAMDNHSSSATQMMKLLFKWNSMNGPKATLEALIDGFNKAIENGVNIDIDKVNSIINEEIK